MSPMLSRSWPFTKWVANAGVEIGANLNVEEDQANRAAVPDPKEILFLSVPDLLTTIKQFLMPEKHEQLDQILQRYMQKELGKRQVRSSSCGLLDCVYTPTCRPLHASCATLSLTAPLVPLPLYSSRSSSVQWRDKRRYGARC